MDAASCKMKAAPVFLLALALAVAGCKTTGTTVGTTAEVDRVWENALAEIPMLEHYMGWQWYKPVGDLPAEDVEGVWPLVIYMHGCSGGDPGPLSKALLRAGFAVITPDSLDRLNYDGSCDPDRHRWGLRRDAPAIRTADLGHTIRQVKGLSWVDTRNVFLVGQSEGGGVVAAFNSSGPELSVRARVIGGTDCRYLGFQAPRSEPVLAILGSEDPTFWSSGGVDGTCGRYMYNDNGSRDVFYTTGLASAMHDQLSYYPPTRDLVVAFLLEHKVQ